MRMPSQKTNNKTVKVVRMKHIPVKKKKLVNTDKATDDSISETISFVIKGKITPLKSTYVSKKANVGKKGLRVLGEKSVQKKMTKKVNNNIDNTTNKLVNKKLLKSTRAKKIQQQEVKGEIEVQIKKSKKQTQTQKTIKREQPEVILPDVLNKKDTIQKLPLINLNNKDNDKTTKERKINKESKVIKKVKLEPVESNIKKVKQEVVKRQKSPSKLTSEINEKDSPVKEITDKKTQQTIAKLLKQANKALKNNAKKHKPVKNSEKPKKKLNATKKVANKQPKVEIKTEPTIQKTKVTKSTNKADIKEKNIKRQIKRKIKVEELNSSTDDTSTSDELTLDILRQNSSSEDRETVHKKQTDSHKIVKKTRKNAVDNEKSKKQALLKQKISKNSQKKTIKVKPKMMLMKKQVLTSGKDKVKRKEDQRSKKMKLFGFWNGPKRHRVASLNALAKVHCLYENESRGNIIDNIGPIKSETKVEKKQSSTVQKEKESDNIPSTRTLRSVPGLRAVGKHWDMHDTTSSSSDENSGNESSTESNDKIVTLRQNRNNKNKKIEQKKKTESKRKRNRTEIIMDLKDMVVRKRMASLNATAILAASYSVEKRAMKSPKTDESSESDDSDETFTDDSDKNKSYEADVKKEDDRKLIEVRATPNKKVAVILNQDTDVTITGVYVNSTTRSTHHEGYCSIAGMQYRISATSHTQTAATAVATETLLQSSNATQESNNCDTIAPCKSYTPLDALSNMQPPAGPGTQQTLPAGPHQHMSGHVIPLGPQHGPDISPIARRHGCTSAFSAPPSGPYASPLHHPHPPPAHGEPGYIHGYYQPAGPLITVPHGHTQQHLGKSIPVSEPSPSSPSPSVSTQQPPPAPSSAGDSSDNEVIITSVTTAKDAVPPSSHQQPPQAYRFNQYPSAHPAYSYSYPPHYYTAPPAPAFSHDLCYTGNPYLPHKYPPTYRRYLTPSAQYYQAHPPDLYNPQPAPSQQSQQVVTASPSTAASSTYQSAPPSGPPPPTLLETYPPPPPPPPHALIETYPPPQHYYTPYGPAPPPSCYAHSPPTRPTLPYLNAAYQSCPCPMQSCPKNVLTGPLTGDSKRSTISIAKESVPLPPVALALPLEPASATGPPSPARGSAGMPPPPSPAGATYQPASTPKQESVEPTDCKPVEKRRKARIGKAMVRNNIAAAANLQQNTMLLMCHSDVKREVESPKDLTTTEQKKEKVEEQLTVIEQLYDETKSVQESTTPITQIQEVQNLKLEEKETVEVTKENEDSKNAVTPTESVEIVQEPCVKTVAENVKVKNMKRKLSLTREVVPKSEPEVTSSPPKKQKIEKCKSPNGSYKDLIKKNTTCIKINNGKRKLNMDDLRSKATRMRVKRLNAKRKLSPMKENTNNKRLKSSRPLVASNLHNLKQNSKETRDKEAFIDIEFSENKEPLKKSNKKHQVNSKTNNSKKLAPDILDNLFAKNNVDRTIDSVITSEPVLRTNKETSALRTNNKCKNDKSVVASKKNTNGKIGQVKNKVECGKKIGASKRKTKNKCPAVIPQTITRIPRRSIHLPKWSNGWRFEGNPFEAKIFLNSDETVVVRRCYPAMRHSEGDIIEPRDCVLLKAGPRKNDLPFVAKIAALWENPDDGEMMMSLLWYYRPEHTEQGRLPSDQPDEVFASRHKDSNSVACIEDKCYVLTFNEYCRYRKNLRRLEEGMDETVPSIPIPEPYPRINRQPPCSLLTSPEMVFFCRRVYDFRQKRIVKNPS